MFRFQMPLAALLLPFVMSLAFAADAAPTLGSHSLPGTDQNREFRARLVAGLGAAAYDDITLARQCGRCAWVVGRQMLFPTNTRPDTPADWLLRTLTVGARTLMHRPCPSCGANPAVAAFHTRLMADCIFLEADCDIQMTVDIYPKGEPEVTVNQMPLKADGKLKRLPWPLTPEKFEDLVGVPFSIRDSWNRLLDQNSQSQHPVFHRVQDGYYLVLRPMTPDAEVDRMKTETVAILDNLTQHIGKLHIESLRDLEDMKRPFTRDTYHMWLPDHAAAVAAGDIQPIAAVNPLSFLKAFCKEAISLGVQATIPSTSGTAVVLEKSPWKTTVNCSGAILRTIHQGLSFQQGAAPLLEEVGHLTQMEHLGKTIADLTHNSYRMLVRDGTTLIFQDMKGKPVVAPEVNIYALARKLDPRDRDITRVLAEAIGLDLKTHHFVAKSEQHTSCSDGKPQALGVKVRPKAFFTDKSPKLLLKEDRGICWALVKECPDRIEYLSQGAPYTNFEEGFKAFWKVLPGLSFPVSDMAWLTLHGQTLACIVGPDASTALVDPALAKALLVAAQQRAKKSGEGAPTLPSGGTGHFYAPFQHVVVICPKAITPQERTELSQMVTENLVGPYGQTDPGAPLDYYQEFALDKTARGRFSFE